MKKVACLYRVSTLMQTDSDNDIPMQRNACMDFIGKQPDWEFSHEYMEAGVSGFKKGLEDRGILQQVQRDAVSKKFDILLVFMFDRLGRKDDETPFIVKWFVDQGVEVWSVNEGQQRFDSHVDNLLNYIRYWQATGESLKTSLRVDEAMRQMTKAGKYTGGRAPYGYHLIETGGVTKKGKLEKDIATDEDEAPIVKLIYELYLRKAMGYAMIARYLNENGISARKGGQWNSCTIAYILKNPIYNGYRAYGRTTAKKSKQRRTSPEEWIFSEQRNEAIALVSERDWESAQAISNYIAAVQSEQHDDNLKINAYHLTKSPLLFVGFIRCGYCGSALLTGYTSSKWINKDGTVRRLSKPSYKCSGKTSGKVGCCSKSAHQANRVETAVLDEVYKFLDSLQSMDCTADFQKLQKNNLAEYEKKVRQLEGNKRDTEQAIVKLKDKILQSIMGETVFNESLLNNMLQNKNEELLQIGKALRVANTELSARKLEPQEIVNMQKMIPTWREEFEKASIGIKKVLLSKIIGLVVVYNDKIEVKMRLKFERFAGGGDKPTPPKGDDTDGAVSFYFQWQNKNARVKYINILCRFFAITKVHENFIFYHRLIDTPTISKKAHKWLIHTVFRFNVISENASVGEKIRFYRRKQDMKCDFFADKIGVSRTSMMDYESGKREPGLEVLERISEALKMPITALCDGYYLFLRYPYNQKLKEIRAEYHLSQAQLGGMIDIAPKSVARWEQGKAIVTRAQWEKLHRLFLIV